MPNADNPSAAGSAPKVRDRPAVGGLHEFGERGQHRSSQRIYRGRGLDAFDVVGGDGVVRLPDGGQVGGLSHAGDPK